MAEFYFAVNGIIERDGKYLIVQEGHGKARGTWNSPGGAVEHGEDPVKALEREIHEETGLEVEKVDGVISIMHSRSIRDNHPVLVVVFKCSVEDGDPKPVHDDEVLDAKFVAEEELEEFEMRNNILLEALEMKENGSLPVESIGKYGHPFLE